MHEDYISIKVRLKYADLDTFQSKFAPYVSPFGMFLPSRNLQPVGSLVEFIFFLSDDTRLFQGRGRVVATYTQESHAAAGMGLQFLSLTSRSHRLLKNILRRKVPRSQLVPDLPPADIGTYASEETVTDLHVTQGPDVELPHRPSIAAPTFSPSPLASPPSSFGDEVLLPTEDSSPFGQIPIPVRPIAPRTAPPIVPPPLASEHLPQYGDQPPRTSPPPTGGLPSGFRPSPPRTAPPLSGSPLPPTPPPGSLQANLPPVIQGTVFSHEPTRPTNQDPSGAFGRNAPASPPSVFGRTAQAPTPPPPPPSIFGRTGQLARPTLGAAPFTGSPPSPPDAPTEMTPVLSGHVIPNQPTEMTPVLSGHVIPSQPTEVTPVLSGSLVPPPREGGFRDVTAGPLSIGGPSSAPNNTMPMATLQGQAVNPTMKKVASLSEHRDELLFFQGKIDDIPSTGPIIGIDLGTTNSCCAIVEEGRPKVLPSRYGYNTIPSIIAFNDEHELLIGHPAKNQMLLNPRNTVYGAKRLIGRKYRSRIVQLIKDRFLYSIVETPQGGSAVHIDRKVFTLEQVSALILSEIRELAQQYLQQPIHRAVISVPAHYNDQQRQAVREAGLMAGLRVERIVNEPTAASLAYGFGRGLQQRLLVYDLGGGTFDASVLEVDKDVFEVISTGGNTFLGGVDFDNVLIDHVIRNFYKETGIDLRSDAIQMQRVRDACEKAKCDLSLEKRARLNIPYLLQQNGKPIHLEQEITRDILNRLVKGLVDETLRVCEAVMKARELQKEDIDEVILVGGMTRMPYIHERLTAYFGKAPHRNVHPDEAVAVGTALLAQSFGKKGSIRLIDVLALPIGIGLPGGRFVPVIQANCPLPFEKSYVTATTRDNQTVLELPIFQGESQNALENEYLGTLRLAGIQPAPKGVNKIELQFKLNNECLLTLRATNLQSGHSESVTLSTKDTPEELSQQLGAPKPESSPLPAHQRPLPWPPSRH